MYVYESVNIQLDIFCFSQNTLTNLSMLLINEVSWLQSSPNVAKSYENLQEIPLILIFHAKLEQASRIKRFVW